MKLVLVIFEKDITQEKYFNTKEELQEYIKELSPEVKCYIAIE